MENKYVQFVEAIGKLHVAMQMISESLEELNLYQRKILANEEKMNEKRN